MSAFYSWLVVFIVSQESESDDDEPLAMQRERIAHSKRSSEAAGIRQHDIPTQ